LEGGTKGQGRDHQILIARAWRTGGGDAESEGTKGRTQACALPGPGKPHTSSGQAEQARKKAHPGKKSKGNCHENQNHLRLIGATIEERGHGELKMPPIRKPFKRREEQEGRQATCERYPEHAPLERGLNPKHKNKTGSPGKEGKLAEKKYRQHKGKWHKDCTIEVGKNFGRR